MYGVQMFSFYHNREMHYAETTPFSTIKRIIEIGVHAGGQTASETVTCLVVWDFARHADEGELFLH
jgi:hypothetical protein